LDISFAEYKGVPPTYASQAGVVAPQYYDAEGEEWLRSFTGGLFTTCGLRQVGNACIYKGEKHGLHGRISNCPASHVCVWEEMTGEEYVISVKGKISETKACAENLILTREITASAGKNKIVIRDTIENKGNTKQPFMLLYHCNMGFPLINDNAKIIIPNKGISSMYEGRERQMERYQYIGPPVEDITEDVFYFDALSDASGFVNVFVINDHNNPQLVMRISYKKEVLNNLAVWKQCSSGDYAIGIEPCNNDIKGVEYAESHDRLKVLLPGEKVSSEICFEVFEGSNAVDLIHGLTV